ncbi:DUF4326 domain-containing protein [Aurantimonas sp. MSK8Z-1]|uniref:DUF4326 domain-containing protein n=1 Tax=Mangrovibrevibacter kandeliae TaxID=2968473 RepID=UPI002118FEB0|nr:DUF4326 domain-containing protein [Aurantimonas sp. MSK8Z-1]MCW4114782.1 DUF4326 domain-containing protein [Aurantimonas sp. MSK8Z-1]
MPSPVRLRLSRARGFDLQAASRAVNGLPAIAVTRPGPWGNPFVAGVSGVTDRAHAVDLYRAMLAGSLALERGPALARQRDYRDRLKRDWPGLAGHNLACWCRLDGGPCHADVLLEAVALLETA